MNGKSAVEAQALALEELGNSRKAARRFRKKHLTEKENEKICKLLAKAIKPCSKGRVVFEVLCFACLVWATPAAFNHFYPGRYDNARTLCYVFSILTIFSEVWVNRHLAKNLPAHSISSRFVMVHNLSLIIFAFAYSMAMCLSSPSGLFNSLTFLVTIVAIHIIPWLRIWLKVRNGKSSWEAAFSGSNPTSAT
jgi:hypothetical protein